MGKLQHQFNMNKKMAKDLKAHKAEKENSSAEISRLTQEVTRLTQEVATSSAAVEKEDVSGGEREKLRAALQKATTDATALENQLKTLKAENETMSGKAK